MSDETAVETTKPTNDVADTPKRSRRKGGNASTGRPRPSATLQRDLHVLEHLLAQKDENDERVGATRSKIAEDLDVKPSEVYLSLFRLNNTGLLSKTGAGVNTLWRANDIALEKVEEMRAAVAVANTPAPSAEPTPDASEDVTPEPVEPQE